MSSAGNVEQTFEQVFLGDFVRRQKFTPRSYELVCALCSSLTRSIRGNPKDFGEQTVWRSSGVESWALGNISSGGKSVESIKRQVLN